MLSWLRSFVAACLSSAGLAAGARGVGDPVDMEHGFLHSPDSQIGVYWFWANTVTKEGVRRDLEEMKRVGIGRAILSMTRAHGATVEDGGVVFLSPEWLALFRYALDEAERQGIKVSAVMSNGWYQGGPWVTPDLGAQMLVWSETAIKGPTSFSERLPAPDKCRPGRRAVVSPKAKDHLQPIAVLACRENGAGELLEDSLARLDDGMAPDGTLNWSVPDGRWRVFRFCHAPNFVPMKQDSPGYTGLQIDHLSARAIDLHFKKVGLPMLEAAGPHVGRTLGHFHEDSMELGHFDWTADMLAQFKARRGYDLIPWLPVLAGKRFAGLAEANRIEYDFLATVDDLLADGHYGRLLDLCHQRGIKLQTEGGDVRGSLQVKGRADTPMGEFWNARPVRSDPRYVEGSNHLRALNPNAIFACRVYGQGRVSFEAFTTAQHWVEYPAMLKPMADEVYCLGANHLTLHGYSYSRPGTPKPGDVYFAGTHFDPGVTWWKYAGEFFAYLNRCQAMLMAGRPVVDILYVDGPETQEMVQMNEARSQTALFKHDVIPGRLLTAQLSVLPEGRVGLPHGASYATLAVANSTIEPEVLEKIAQLARDGATVWFRTVPRKTPEWFGYPQSDETIANCLRKLGADKPASARPLGKGKVMFGDASVKDMLARVGIAPDFAYMPDDKQPFLDYVHRRVADADVYFVANWKDAWHEAECVFRVQEKQPELWDPVTGRIVSCSLYQVGQGAIRLPLRLPPYGSTFIVFRKKAETDRIEEFSFDGAPVQNAPADQDTATLFEQEDGAVRLEVWQSGVYTLRNASGATQEVAFAPFPTPRSLEGPWRIQFTPAREDEPRFEITVPGLFLWDESADPRIKGFAGTASYHREFEVAKDWLGAFRRIFLDLGTVHNVAEVVVNGRPAGTVWTPPFRLDITQALQPGANRLEIRVTNTWHNWRLANKYQPLKHPWSERGLKEPMASGLAGPARLICSENREIGWNR